MSSPIGHSLAGFILASCKFGTLKIKNYKPLILYIFIANLPDLDFLPGILLGTPNLFHHGISHSLGMGIIFSFLLAYVLKSRKIDAFWDSFLLCFCLYSSHLLLDYISMDERPPSGIPIFWPIMNKYYIFPRPILPSVWHSILDHASIIQFLKDAFSIHNLYVIVLEIVIMSPILFFLWLFKFLKSRN